MNGIYISPKPVSSHSINIDNTNFAGDYQAGKTVASAVATGAATGIATAVAADVPVVN